MLSGSVETYFESLFESLTEMVTVIEKTNKDVPDSLALAVESVGNYVTITNHLKAAREQQTETVDECYTLGK